MKLVAIDYTYTVVCRKKVEVPDDFTFESSEPDDMVDEINFDISEINVTGDGISSVEFDGIRTVELDDYIYPF